MNTYIFIQNIFQYRHLVVYMWRTNLKIHFNFDISCLLKENIIESKLTFAHDSVCTWLSVKENFDAKYI